MRLKKIIYVFVLGLLPFFCKAQISDKLKINKQDFTSEKVKAYDKIDWKSDYRTKDLGSPELPVYRVSYVLPVDAIVTGVTFKTKEKQRENGLFDIVPVQQRIPTDNTASLQFTEPNKTIYLSDTPYPNKLYDIESDIFFQGYHMVTLRIYPFEYIPKSKILNYYSNLEYTIEYTTGTKAGEIRPLTQNIRRAEQCKSFVKSLVQNRDDVDRFGSNAQTLRNGRTTIQNSTVMPKTNRIQKTKALSILDEITPDYIIITNNALKSTFQTLADWKTKKGVFTIIKTTEEIDANYQGSDLQEKIRNYIIDAFSKWGAGLYILLGGGIDIVPARMVIGYENMLYPADMYYATYTGNWNTNGDNIFEEDHHENYSMGVILGRVPINNRTEAITFIKKVISYEKADNIPNVNYFKNNLYAVAYMGNEGTTSSPLLDTFEQAGIKSICSAYVPTDTINNRFICDNALCTGDSLKYLSQLPQNICPGGDIELNKTNFLSCLNTGGDVGKFHIIYHMDHGSSQGISTSGTDKGEGVSKVDLGNRTNGTSYQIFMSIACHSANFAEDCNARYYLADSVGGGVVWIGNTDVGGTSDVKQLKYFLSSIYGKGSYKTGRYDIGTAYQNIIKQIDSKDDWYIHLLGDPEMQVWTNVPQTLNITGVPVAVLLGEQTDTITILNLPLGEKAMICIQKGTEIYVTQEVIGTGSPISTIMNFTVDTPGEVNVTVTAHNFFPYETTMTANQTPAPNIFISSVDFNDAVAPGIGNGDGKNDAGETIDLSLTFKNTGISNADFPSETLSCNSPYISISSNYDSFVNLVSGAESTRHFRYTINKNTPEILENDTIPIRFCLGINAEGGYVWKDTFNIAVFKDSIVQRNKTMPGLPDGIIEIVAGQTNIININLQNMGQAPAVGLIATLTRDATKDTNGYILSCPSAVTYPTLNQFGASNSQSLPYQILISDNYPGGSEPLWFNLQVENAYGKIWNSQFNLMDKPNTGVSGLDFTADMSEIDLFWTPLSNEVSGYNIYRCDVDSVTGNEVGDYVKLNNTPVKSSFYSDTKNLSRLTKYRYKVAAVSATGNEGPTTNLLAWTSYSKDNNYPVTLDPTLSWIKSSINVADINYDGFKEIFAGTSTGLLGFDYYGNELFNIDNNITTVSGFRILGAPAWGVPALADTKKDGRYSFIEPTRSGNSTNYVYSYLFEDKKDDSNAPTPDSKPDLNWSYSPVNPILFGAVVANIDNSADGSMETVVGSEDGNIYVFKSNGTLLKTITCTGAYGSFAVADIDNDGIKEIVKGIGTGIYVWHYNGSDFIPHLLFSTDSGYQFASPIIVCDIDNSNDGQKEILTFAISGNYIGKLYAIRNDGTTVSGLDGSQTISTNQNWGQGLSVGNLDSNPEGNLKIVTLAGDGIKIWSNTGVPQVINSKTFTDVTSGAMPLLADVDNDHSDVEIIFCSTTTNNIYAYKLDGYKVSGFPLRASDVSYVSACVADVDNDGKNELIAGTNDKIQMWETNGIPSKIEWGSERHDQYNTGEYQTICDPTLITTDATWSSSQSVCGDLVVKSGTLTINSGSNLTMGSSSMIIVMSGASLVIDSGHILNANVRAMAGSHVTLTNNGSITLRSNAEFYTEIGTTIDMPYGTIDK